MNVGYIGECMVAVKLAEYDWIIHVAPRGCASHDLIIWKPDLYRLVQVETYSKGSTFQVCHKHEDWDTKNLWHVFVSLEGPRFWVIPYYVVSVYVQQEHKNWLAAKEGRVTNSIRRFWPMGSGWTVGSCWND